MKRDSRQFRRNPDRKQRQLCSQEEQAIDLALGASSDPLLQGCWVVDVRPAPSQAHLRIRIRSADEVDEVEIRDCLQRATAWLRSEVSVFISRRKTPNLTLVWAPPGSEEP